jgi:hypothetical protein
MKDCVLTLEMNVDDDHFAQPSFDTKELLRRTEPAN